MKDNNRFVNKHLGTIDIKNIDEFIKKHEIATGKFKGINVGNTFNIIYNGEEKRIIIIGLDSMYGISTNEHHIVCIPDGDFGYAYMNKEHTTGISEYNKSGLKSFAGSDMFNITLPKINDSLEKVFGGHLLTSKEVLEDGDDSVGIYECKALLLSEKEVFGKSIYSNDFKDDKSSQLPLFKILEHFWGRNWYWAWLRNKRKDSSTHFCLCDNFGCAYYNVAGYGGNVRPRFLIG